ncbi:MAG: hypothetical protein AB7J35_07200 [Dehalococcoidia bacterium]
MSQPEDVQPLIDSGMTRQMASYRSAIADGMPRLGWKIGINDPAAQERMGLTETLIGWLDGRRVFREGEPYSPPVGATPRIEAEVAVRMAADLPRGASFDEARAAIDSVAPAIEFVNGAKPIVPLDEMLAHDILHDGVLFGPDAPLDTALGLVAEGFPAVRHNGELIRAGIAGRYPDDLAEIVAHTADVLAEYGEVLRAGDRIICGSYIDPFPVSSGDTVEVDFGALGKLSFSVA